MPNRFDIAVIGSGPGGYAAAGRAAQLGMNTVLVEKESLGGVCLNWGCIPTKALLESAHHFANLQNAGRYGLTCSDPGFDFEAIIQRSRQIAERMSKGIQFLMKQRGVTVKYGSAALGDPGTVEIESESGEETVRADHIVLATGGEAVPFPGVPFDGLRILNARQAMSIRVQPRRLAIIGAGAIGMEFADFYRTLGSEVTVIEMMDQVLPVEDPEIITELSRSLRRKKISTITGARVTDVEQGDSELTIHIDGPRGPVSMAADALIVAIGVRPVTAGLNLEQAGVRVTDRGFIHVNDRLGTSVPGVYAIGDVTGPPLLAHKATMEAVLCINALAGHFISPMDAQQIPACTYCHPQVASVGYTEPGAMKQGYEVLKGSFPFRANGRSIAMNESDGLVKLVFDAQTHRLLGGHILHAAASELIAELALALKLSATAENIAETVHAHPTLSEAVMEAAAAALGEAVHI